MRQIPSCPRLAWAAFSRRFAAKILPIQPTANER